MLTIQQSVSNEECSNNDASLDDALEVQKHF